MLNKKRVFEAVILRTFSTFHSLRRMIVISEKMPVPSEVPTKENEEVVEVRELRNVEFVIR